MSTYNIEASVAVQVTVPGPVAYSSQQTRAGFTLGETVEADSPEEARDIALARANQIAEDAKIAVATNAPGVTIATDENGVTQLTFLEGGETEVSAPQASATPVKENPTNGQTAEPTGPVDVDELPKKLGEDRYLVQWNGIPVTLFDNRKTKEGNQPDFRLVYENGEDDAFWLKLKSGGENRAAKALAGMVASANG